MSTDASAEPAVGLDPVVPDPDVSARSPWRAAALRLGALAGGFGIVAVVVGILAVGAVQRSQDAVGDPAAITAADVVPTAPAVAAPESSRATGSADEHRSPTRRIDQAWAGRTAAATGIPLRAVLAYASATVTVDGEQPGCGLAWNTLAGIGAVESGHGAHGGARLLSSGATAPVIRGPVLNGASGAAIRDTDGGAWDGNASWDRAMGPMQFIPSTWRRWGADGNGDGVADPDQIDDAALAAARYLCASGSLTTAPGWRAAVYSYNHSDAYVDRVAAIANQYAAASR